MRTACWAKVQRVESAVVLDGIADEQSWEFRRENDSTDSSEGDSVDSVDSKLQP